MLTLHGSPISNYYNKVKFALLEKGIPFEEAKAPIHSTEEAVLSASPLGKIPFLMTERGPLCESQALLEYVEAVWPEPALLPADPYEAAKVRELCTFVDWHVEMAARQLYGAAFFGAPPLSEANATRIRGQLERNIAALRRLVRFDPFIAGPRLTLADCSAFPSLSLVAMATKATYGEDLLLAGGIDHKTYTRMMGERPAGQKVLADRKAAQAPKAA